MVRKASCVYFFGFLCLLPGQTHYWFSYFFLCLMNLQFKAEEADTFLQGASG